MLKRRTRNAWVVETEDDGLAGPGVPREVADERIVAVHDEDGVRKRRDGLTPALGDQLELPVPVELVAEEVAEAENSGPKPPRNLGQSGLVDLEQAELGAARREEGGGDARDEVRAGRVVGEPVAPPQHLRGHRGRGRLPVRGGDDRRACRKPRGETVDRPRVRFPEQLARQRRAAAGPEEARKDAGCAGAQDLRSQAHPRAHELEPTAIAVEAPVRGILRH